MNRGQLIARVKGRLGTPETDLMDDYFMDGYRDVLIETHCRVRSQTVTVGDLTAQAAGDFLLPDGMLAVASIVTDEGTLEPVQPDEIRNARLALGVTGPTVFAVEGSDLLMLFPTPDDDAELTIYYVPDPEEATSDSYEPSFVPSAWHRLIEEYMLWKAADSDDDTTSFQGERYREHYQDGLARARRAFRNMGGPRRARARVGRRRYAVSPGVDVR